MMYNIVIETFYCSEFEENGALEGRSLFIEATDDNVLKGKIVDLFKEANFPYNKVQKISIDSYGELEITASYEHFYDAEYWCAQGKVVKVEETKTLFPSAEEI